MPDVILATGREMPRPESESPLLISALGRLGLSAALRSWGPGTDWSAASLVVVRTTWDYTANRSAFLTWAHECAAVTSFVNPVEVLASNSHKGYLCELARAGVPVVPTRMLECGSALRDQDEALGQIKEEAVVKPAVSAGARGTRRGSPAELAPHLAALLRSGDALVQPFVGEVREGEKSLVFFGGDFHHAVRKVPAPGDYRVQALYGGRVEPTRTRPVELEVARAALAQVAVPLSYARVDLVETSEGPAVMELELIEPELFLSHHPSAAGRFAAVLAGLVGEPPAASSAKQP